MDVLEAIVKRRSIRQFGSKKVSEGLIRKILEAGRWAPSGKNNQPWNFMKVIDEDVKSVFSPHTKYAHIIREAPVCIAVFLDKSKSYDYVKDVQAIGACLQNMLLAAHGLGLGAVWLGEIRNEHEEVERELQAASDLELMAVIAVGHKLLESGKSSRLDVEKLLIN